MLSMSLRSFSLKVACISTVCILCLCKNPFPSYAADFAVTSPWLFEITNFISGGKSQVRCLSVWSSNGDVSVVSSPKGGEVVIALNMEEASLFKINRNNKLHLLYQSLSIPVNQTRSLFYDPAVIPLTAQNVMKVIAKADNKNYAYYQRRLAELQARIESTNNVGKHLLKSVKILDLTVSQGVWVRSAVNNPISPPVEVWNKWLNGDSEALKAALDEAKKRGWTVILDPWTPNVIRSVALMYDHCVALPSPKIGVGYFAHLHNIYLSIWNKIKAPVVIIEK